MSLKDDLKVKLGTLAVSLDNLSARVDTVVAAANENAVTPDLIEAVDALIVQVDAKLAE